MEKVFGGQNKKDTQHFLSVMSCKVHSQWMQCHRDCGVKKKNRVVEEVTAAHYGQGDQRDSIRWAMGEKCGWAAKLASAY